MSTTKDWEGPYDNQWSRDMHKSLRERIKQLRMNTEEDKKETLGDDS